VESVCESLGVGRSSAYAAARLLESRLSGHREPPRAKEEGAKGVGRERDFLIEVLSYERAHPGCRLAGSHRTAIEPAYKAWIEESRRKYGLTQSRCASLLEIPIDTLKKFSSRVSDVALASNEKPRELPIEVVELVNTYLRTGRGTKSVKGFCDQNPELLARLGMSYREVLAWLRALGLTSPRGIFLKNSGLDKIIRFKPNQLWQGDGKILDVVFNGKLFRSVWQCLVDGKTSAIVGGVIAEEENTQNLVDSLKDAEQKTGVKPMGIVLDNRLSENLPAVQAYFDEHQIEIVKTYPGNSKSNGIVEENFNIFDRYVGRVVINGHTPEEIVHSVKQAVVEIFTQMKNRKPRRSFSNKSRSDVIAESDPGSPEEQLLARQQIKALADRLMNEQAEPEVTAEKKAAILQAIEKTNPPQREVFEKALENSRFTPELILSSLAILEQRRSEHPEKKYGHAYFGGILRKQADSRAVELLNTHLGSVYAHHWETMGKLKQAELAESIKSHPDATCTRLAADFLNMPVPAFSNLILIDLKRAFFVAARGNVDRAAELRTRIANLVVTSQRAARERRQRLLCTLMEWENFIRRATRPAPGAWMAPAPGNA
jgi:hypothetical protein